ncbi:MAG: NADH-quinone oxidoreductase subunit NuoG [Armatimonadetes bacterium]|nr:NADH-quinone oxidoreductase subunit NuoG [Armatimonadota bacterium]MBX3108658.1 NADH-quinone oxidoreductase subunit NuoG [Fimbriimonadaceae bacterium]
MATVAQENLVTVTINDVEIQVPNGELIVESVKRLGLEVPIFCYHPRMKPVGMCRMCLVEVGFKQADGSVRKMPKPQAACTLPASDNMVVYTDTAQVHKDRKGVLEFLLVNHPLDCPICDRGGECPLQNNTIAYGPSTSRFLEIKRHAPKAFPLSQYVTLDLERCIQCGRCVRFTEEISGDAQLAFRFRGAEMQPSTFQLTDFESKFSGNVIEICPVGALTSSHYRFRARPWDLETAPGICTVTPCGTNVWFDHRAGKFVRINGRTNEEVNEEWTADRCKFGHDFYNDPTRVMAPNMRDGDGFRLATWGEINQSVASLLEGAGNSAALLASQKVSNEGLFAAKKLFDLIGSTNVDSRSTGDYMDASARPANRFGAPAPAPIAELERQDSVLVFGTSPADEQPMSFLRIRKGWFQRGMKVVVAHHGPTDADSFAHVVLRYNPGTENYAAAALASAMGVEAAKDVDFAKSCTKSGLNESDVRAAAEALKGKVTILTTHTLPTTNPGVEALTILTGTAGSLGHSFNYMGLECNSEGAARLGLVPASDDHNTKSILENCAQGKIKALVLLDFDPIDDCPFPELAVKALEAVENLILICAVPGSSAAYATHILPMALPAEQDGTYTSAESRIQRMKQAIAAPGETKAPWRIFTELSLRIQPGTPPFNPAEIMGQIAIGHPEFAGAEYGRLPATGFLLPPAAKPFDAKAFAGSFPKPA